MQYQGYDKSKSGNPGGRPKGSKNKNNKAVQEFILTIVKKVGGQKEFLKLYKDPKSEWAKRLLWDKYFDLIPREMIGDFDVRFAWVGENGKPDNGPI